MSITRSTIKKQSEGAWASVHEGSHISSIKPKASTNAVVGINFHGTNAESFLTVDPDSKSFPPPGSRLLPHVVDELAATDPEGAWLSIPSYMDATTLTFTDIMYQQLSNAVNRAAWWIDERLHSTRAEPRYTLRSQPWASGTAKTLAYLGPTDSRYLILLIAAIKVGHRLLLPSTRNSGVEQRKLLDASGCCVVFCADSERVKIDAALEEDGMVANKFSVFTVPSQKDLLSVEPARRYPYSKVFDKEMRNPFVVLHTSGTGGDPKPVELPHSYYAYEDKFKAQFTKDAVLTFAPLIPGVRCLYTGPLYHAGAVLFTLMKSLFLKATMLILPPDEPVTAEVVEHCILQGQAHMLGTAPSVLESLCANPRAKKCLEGLTDIFCGSGPMPTSVGDTLKNMDVNLLHIYGSTETGLMLELPLDDPEVDWEYFKFHPATGARFVPVGGDGFSELVIQRIQGDRPQPCFELFPKLKEYHTKDTFSEHPAKTGLWKFEGRMDSIITLTTGEKFCPLAIEESISDHPAVNEALVVGQGRSQPVLVVCAKSTAITPVAFLAELWPTVQAANLRTPGYAKICKHFIVLTKKCFARTPKGTIRRHQTEELLLSEIEAVYGRSNEIHEI